MQKQTSFRRLSNLYGICCLCAFPLINIVFGHGNQMLRLKLSVVLLAVALCIFYILQRRNPDRKDARQKLVFLLFATFVTIIIAITAVRY